MTVVCLERAHARAAVRARARRRATPRTRSASTARAAYVWSTARSGMPGRLRRPCPCTARPASCRRGTARWCRPCASELPHAVVIAFFASSAVSFESAAFTTTWRHASPPLALMYFAHALHPVDRPWNSPGRSGEPVSAITVTVIVVGRDADLGRLSAAWSCRGPRSSRSEPTCCRASAPLPMLFPPPHAAATNTIASRTPTQPKRLKVPPQLRRPTDLMDRQIGKCEPAPPYPAMQALTNDHPIMSADDGRTASRSERGHPASVVAVSAR